jgi:PAS domain S-box-containing protein
MTRDSGWPALFLTAFKRSDNPMALVDDTRRLVDANRAVVRLLMSRREELIGRPVYELRYDGPPASEAEWQRSLSEEEFTGRVDLMRSDGSPVTVQYAAHPEVVTGKRLVLVVAMSISRSGRHLRREVRDGETTGALSDRELEVARLVALGASGPEIAAALHISHNTVRTHVRNAMIKVGARSRAQLVAKALGDGHVLR